jgi:hypothetical protein
MSAEPKDVNVARLRARVLWLSAQDRFRKGASTVHFKRNDIMRMLEIDLSLPDELEAFGGMSEVIGNLPDDGNPKWDGVEFVFTDPVKNREKPETGEIVKALDYWREKTGRTKAVEYTHARVAIVRARLRDGYTMKQLQIAVDRMMESEFHTNGGFTDCVHCWKTERIERWLAHTAARPTTKHEIEPAKEIERVARETIRRRKI